MNSHLQKKYEALKSFFNKRDSVLVAYSGGVDSALVAYMASKHCDNMKAIIAKSPSLASYELEAAQSFALKHEIPLEVIETNEIQKEGYVKNAGDRCYYCKQTLFEKMQEVQTYLIHKNEQQWTVAYGVNMDDLGDYRPGLKAASEFNVLRPLVEAQMNKEDVRNLAKELNLEVFDKPASPCLSSRIPHGSPVTIKKLSQIEKAEGFLKQLGLKLFRVRHFDAIAKVEVADEELNFVMNHRKAIDEELKRIGFVYVSLDMAGFESGSLNKTLELDKINE